MRNEQWKRIGADFGILAINEGFGGIFGFWGRKAKIQPSFIVNS